jgi:hypothetical protein
MGAIGWVLLGLIAGALLLVTIFNGVAGSRRPARIA